MNRRLSANGRVYKELAGDYPRLMVEENGDVTELTHRERAMLQFYRRLPDDLKPEFGLVLADDGRPFKQRLAEFEAKLAPRRHEVTGSDMGSTP